MVSLSKDRRWVLPYYPLIPDGNIVLDWDNFLPAELDNRRDADRLKKSFMLYFSVLVDHLEGGKKFAPTTLERDFLDHRAIARWMARSGIWGISELKISHVLEFLRSRKSRTAGNRPAQRTIDGWVHKFQRMWDLRDRYKGSIKIDVGCFEDEINTQVKGRQTNRWKALPDNVAFALITDGLNWVETFGDFCLEYMTAYVRYRSESYLMTEDKRNRFSKIFFEKLRSDDRFKLLANRLNYSGRTSNLMLIALGVLEGACLVLLFILVGMRISEVMALSRYSLTSEDIADGFRYLSGPAAKKDGAIRRWVLGRPLVQVVELMIKFGDIVRNGGSSALFLNRHNASGLFDSSKKAIRMSRTSMLLRLHYFAVSGLRNNSVQAEKFHPHMGRKTFAQLAVRRDRSLLEPVSAHLGHVYQSFTDGVYVGQDHSLAALLSEADRRELAASLEHLLSCGTIVGGGAKGLEKARLELKFKGKRALKSVVKGLVEKGVKIAPCDWGFCMYNEAFSACGGNTVGPDEAKRSPDVCAGCKNFAVTERHRHWWEDRIKREEKFLLQKNLPEQTVALVSRRLSRSKDVLKDVVWLQAPVPKSESM